MSKPVTALDVLHAISTVIAQHKGVASIIKTHLSDLELIRDCLSTEIDENRSLQEQLKKEREAHKKEREAHKKEREAHKKDNEIAAHNFLQVIKERDGLVDLLALYQKPNEKRPPNPFGTRQSPPTVKRDGCVRIKDRISDRGMAVSADTNNAWDKQVGGDHYKQYAIQPAQFALANNLDYAQANAIKYIVRHADKNGVQDLDKAIHYVELLKAHHYKGE